MELLVSKVNDKKCSSNFAFCSALEKGTNSCGFPSLSEEYSSQLEALPLIAEDPTRNPEYSVYPILHYFKPVRVNLLACRIVVN